MTRGSGTPRRGSLLVAQGVDRIEPGRLAGRVDAEKDADQGREAEGEPHRPERHVGRRPIAGENLSNSRAQTEAQGEPQAAAEEGEGDRLDEELEEDVLPPRPHRLPHPDLPRP